MKEEYKAYMSMLRSFVNGNAPIWEDSYDIGQILNLSRINNTWGLIGYTMMSYPSLFPTDLVQGLRKDCMREITIYAQRSALMDEQVRLMNEQGIDHILFKGYVVRNYYPVPELRTFGDVDYVIRKQDREKSHASMLEQGFQPHYDWEPVYDYTRGQEYYEIHTDVMEIDVSDKADFVGYYSHIWEHVFRPDEAGKPHTYEFTPEFHLIYLLTHIAKHISSSGAGIRMYMDIAFFIRHFGDSLDWDWIRGEFETLRFQDFANITFTAVEEWFGVKSPIPLREISPDIMEEFLSFTLEGGLFGHNNRDQSVVMLKKNDRNNEEEVSKLKTLLFHIFPSVDSMKHRYAFLQKYPFLLPIAWIRRFVDNRDSWGRYVDSAKGLMDADVEEAMRLKRLYKEIGL